MADSMQHNGFGHTSTPVVHPTTAARSTAPPPSAAGPSSVPSFFFDPALLDRVGSKYGASYREAKPFPHIVMDGLFPANLLENVLAEFPDPTKTKWKQCYHANSKKLSCADETMMGSVTRNLIAQLNSGLFLSFLEQLTGIAGLLPDPHLFGGGLHLIEPGGFLKIHADFNIHEKLRLDRRLNALLFLNQDWHESYGGHFEMWDREMTKCQARVLPVINRFVVFSTTDWSYHGHPEPLTCPPGRSRKSIAMYYYTNGRPAEEMSASHSTLYQRPRGTT
jgi:hypothetical protein